MKRIATIRVVLVGTLAGLAASGWATVASAQQSTSQWDGVYSAAQAKRGEALFSRACAACHGGTLTGGDRAPALAGVAFTGRWNDRTLGDLFEYMSAMMPLQSPGGFSPEQNGDILAYVLSKGNYPAGQADLPVQADALKRVKFLAAKP
jgi:mono/diheme cytochrome c family protein